MKKINDYFNRIYKKISEWFNNISIAKKFIVCLVGVFILAIAVKILSGIKIEYEIIDYNNYSKEEILGSSLEDNDRLVFLKSEDIINQIFEIYNGNYNIDNKKITLDDYYEYVIYYEYKYALNKRDFKKNVNNIIEDCKEQYGTTNLSELKTESIIDKVYSYTPRSGMYMVKLNIDKNEHFVGIKYSTVNNTYSIFYIE